MESLNSMCASFSLLTYPPKHLVAWFRFFHISFSLRVGKMGEGK